MLSFIKSALPGLLLGTLLGFGLARLGQGEDDEKQRDTRVAELCLNEARKMFAVSERSKQGARPERSSNPERRSEAGDPVERAERTLATTLKRATKDKSWTVAHGKMAQRLLPRVSDDTRTKFEKDLLAAIDEGNLAVEAGAWLPKK